MVISHNKIINLPVYFENKKIGVVLNIIIDPERGLFLYLILDKNRYIKVESIKEFFSNKVLIKDKKINEITEKYKNIIINNKVCTLAGEGLGRVSDFEIDLTTNKLSKIYVSGGNIIKQLIRGELIINKDQIISMEEKKITVDNIILKSKNVKDKLLQPRKEELAGANFSIKVN